MKELSEQIKVMQAFKNGHKIQFQSKDGEWFDTAEPGWNWVSVDYRIKKDVSDPQPCPVCKEQSFLKISTSGYSRYRKENISDKTYFAVQCDNCHNIYGRTFTGDELDELSRGE